MDPFDELGLKQGQCTEDDVTKAFRKLALKNHPDKAGPGGVKRMASINAARDRIMNEKLCSKPPPAERRPRDASTYNEHSSQRRPEEPRSRNDRFREHYASEPSPHDTRSYGAKPNERGPYPQRYQDKHLYEEDSDSEDINNERSHNQRAHDEGSYERRSYKQRYQDERSPHDRSYEPQPREQRPRDESSYERQSYKQRYSEQPPREQRPCERHRHKERSYERSAYEQHHPEQRPREAGPQRCPSHKRHAHEEHFFEEHYYEERSYGPRPQGGCPLHAPHPDTRAQPPRQRAPQASDNVLEKDFWKNMPDLMRDVHDFLTQTRPIRANTGRTPRTKVRELHDDIQSHLLHPFRSGEKERICSLMGSLLFAVKQHELFNTKTDRDRRRVKADYTLNYTMSKLDWVRYDVDGSLLVETWLYACMPDIERQWRKEEMRWEVEGIWNM